ncbi:MAG: DUF192 domain-containing protein [Thermoleophilia bacterium]
MEKFATDIIRLKKAAITGQPFSFFTAILLALLTLSWAGACGGGSTASDDAVPPSTGSGTAPTATATGSTSPASASSPLSASVIFHPAGGGRDAALLVEIARTDPEKARGLMYRTQLGTDAGMIFIWEQPVQDGFWMKNTPLPLSVAFITTDGIIEDIQDMEPYTTQVHMPPGSYIYAVEANRGWFSGHGIKAGDSAEFIGQSGGISSEVQVPPGP